MAHSAERAQELALSGLIYMTERPELIAGFMGATGLRPDDLRGMARDPDLALHVLDYLAQDDARVLDAAEALGVRPEDLMAARMMLAGPGSHGWDVD